MREEPSKNLVRTAKALEHSFPDLGEVGSLRLLGSGFRSLAVETPIEIVFLIGLSSDAAAQYKRLWASRHFFAGGMGSLLPEPRWYAEPSVEFPHGVLGYRKLAGDTPACGSDPGPQFARDLGGFMARLHQLPTSSALAAGIPEVDSYQRVAGAWPVISPFLVIRLESEAFERIRTWFLAFTEDERMQTPLKTVSHHDLWHDNLLCSEAGRLSGVLDIAHIEVGDAAQDFAAPHYFGDVFMTELVSAYRAAGGRFDETDEYRAERYWESREFGGLAWAIEHNDQPEVEDAIQKILTGPLLHK